MPQMVEWVGNRLTRAMYNILQGSLALSSEMSPEGNSPIQDCIDEPTFLRDPIAKENSPRDDEHQHTKCAGSSGLVTTPAAQTACDNRDEGLGKDQENESTSCEASCYVGRVLTLQEPSGRIDCLQLSLP